MRTNNWLTIIGSKCCVQAPDGDVLDPDKRMVIAALSLGMIAGALLWPAPTAGNSSMADRIAVKHVIGCNVDL